MHIEWVTVGLGVEFFIATFLLGTFLCSMFAAWFSWRNYAAMETMNQIVLNRLVDGAGMHMEHSEKILDRRAVDEALLKLNEERNRLKVVRKELKHNAKAKEYDIMVQEAMASSSDSGTQTPYDPFEEEPYMQTGTNTVVRMMSRQPSTSTECSHILVDDEGDEYYHPPSQENGVSKRISLEMQPMGHSEAD